MGNGQPDPRRECLWCGTKGTADNPITRDHVISKMELRNILGDKYQEFATKARGIQVQPLCADCNNKKGSKSCDLRSDDERFNLIMLCAEYDILREVNFMKPEEVFGG